MPITAPRPTLLGALTPALALMLGLPMQEAQALGLGRPQVLSALGRPLDVSVALTLADGEQLSESCLRAEVTAGDARVPAGLLQLRIEGDADQRRIRLRSQVRIEEPALHITLAVGCPLLLTREFNAFVDPPAGTAVAPPAPVALPPAVPPAVVTAPAADAAPRVRLEVKPPAASLKARARAKVRPSGPRLTLERPEVLVAAAPQPVKPAASAPDMELTPELESQITQLEATVAKLRAELLARQETQPVAAATVEASSAAPASSASAMEPAPAASVAPAIAPAAPATAVVRSARSSPYRDPMTWVMTLALSLLAGAGAFYVSRWRDLRARRELAYWRALHAAEGAGMPRSVGPARAPSPPQMPSAMAPPVISSAAALPDEGQHQATRPQPRPMPWPPAPLGAPEPPSFMQATQPLPQRPEASAAELPSDLTIADELLDLQQQIDFLQLLGQHEAAADLLAARLTRGGAGAMPHLLLMELCQQRGEPEVFAELAKQFERRFGGLAPSWSQSLSRGRSLDGCPSVIAHLQVVWSEAGAAMKMLQDLLAQGGGPGVTHFDLPAYRDLLTLYSVARDLFEAGLRGDGVDLMLPMDSAFGA